MKEILNIVIPFAPVPKARARSVITKHNKIRHYTPNKTKTFEHSISVFARQVIKEPFICPIRLNCTFYIETPKSWSKKKRSEAMEGRILPTSRPDLDNYVKSVLDGLNEILYKDDSQVIEISARKKYNGHGSCSIKAEGLL